MGYLIDTNILSELQKGKRCHAGVQRWYAATDSDELFLSVLVIGEIRLGIERLRRRDAIQAVRLEQKLLAVESLMTGRILPITQAIAELSKGQNSILIVTLLALPGVALEKQVTVDIEAMSKAFCVFFTDGAFTCQNFGYAALRGAIAQVFLM